MNNKHKIKNKLTAGLGYRGPVLAIATASALASAVANAQQTVSDTTDMENLIEEVIVSASRREQSLQDTAAAVSALSPDDLLSSGKQSLQEALDYTVGINMTNTGNPGTGSISARGIPQTSAIPVFGIYLDDTPLTTNTAYAEGDGIFFDGMLTDIERIEVIRGPQGTLFGATSVGGMLRYISRAPTLDEARGQFSVDTSHIQGGEWGETFSGRVSLPIIEDTLGITISGFTQDAPGYIDALNPSTRELIKKNANDASIEGYSADVLFVPGDNLELRFKYITQETELHIEPYVNLANIDSDRSLNGDFTSQVIPGLSVIDYDIYSFSAEYDFGWANLTSTSSYSEYNSKGNEDFTSRIGPLIDAATGQPPGTYGITFESEKGSEKYVQEIRLTSPNNNQLEWLAGIYYADEETKNKQDLNANPPLLLLDANLPSEYEELAAFGNVTFYILDQLDITLGARLSKHETVLDYTMAGLIVTPGQVLGDKHKATVDTYLLSARYRINDDHSLYTRIASGYRPEATALPLLHPVTRQNLVDPVLESDEAWSYEIGAKGMIADGALSYDTALWYVEWDNFQTNITAFGASTSDNAKDGLTAYGFEAGLTWAATDSLEFIANAAYTSSKLNDDEPGIGGAKNDDTPNLPNWQASLQWKYNFDVFQSDWTGDFGGGIRYTGETDTAWSQSPEFSPTKVDSRAIADINLSVSNDQYTIGLYVKNLFDERALVQREDAYSDAGLLSRGLFERPRTIGANIRFEF